jgi:hypothetical protein
MEYTMSQADSAYTTSRSILPSGLALRRRQFVTGGAAIMAAAVTASRAESFPVPEAPDPILDAIEGHRRAFEELLRLLAEQAATERELRRASRSRRGALEAQLVGLCEAEGLLGCAETKASLRLAKTVPASLTGAAAALRHVRHHRFCPADLAAPADLSRALRSGYVTREQPRSPVRTVSAKSTTLFATCP